VGRLSLTRSLVAKPGSESHGIDYRADKACTAGLHPVPRNWHRDNESHLNLATRLCATSRELLQLTAVLSRQYTALQSGLVEIAPALYRNRSITMLDLVYTGLNNIESVKEQRYSDTLPISTSGRSAAACWKNRERHGQETFYSTGWLLVVRGTTYKTKLVSHASLLFLCRFVKML
jgi:hypothetical protein